MYVCVNYVFYDGGFFAAFEYLEFTITVEFLCATDTFEVTIFIFHVLFLNFLVVYEHFGQES